MSYKPYLFLSLLLASCGNGNNGHDTPEPPAAECSFIESEPNNSLDDANYVGLMPVVDSEAICGRGWKEDSDNYHFFLNPPFSVGNVQLSFFIKTKDAIPTVSLYQTEYGPVGDPRHYKPIGVFFGNEYGQLGVYKIQIPYHYKNANDLYIAINFIGDISKQVPYKFEYWSY